MRVNLHLHNLAWDIKMAYTWAPLPPGERVAVIRPDGFKHMNDKGEETYLILEKCLYGMPSAARGWGKHRDAFILERFNQEGWSCIKSVHDPCLFVIDKRKDHGQKSQPSCSGQSPTMTSDAGASHGQHRTLPSHDLQRLREGTLGRAKGTSCGHP